LWRRNCWSTSLRQVPHHLWSSVYIVVDVDCADDIFVRPSTTFSYVVVCPNNAREQERRELKAPQFAVKELNRLALLLEFLKFADHNVFADFSCSRGRFLTCGRSRRFLLSETRCGLQVRQQARRILMHSCRKVLIRNLLVLLQHEFPFLTRKRHHSTPVPPFATS